MINTMLKAKHWQLFLITYVLPTIIQFVLMGFFISSILSIDTPDPEAIFNFMPLVPILMLLFVGVFFLWLWSVVIGLNNRLSEHLEISTGLFKFALFGPVLFMAFFSFFMINMMDMMTAGINGAHPVPDFSMFGLFFIIQLIAMVSIFYCFYICAKTIKTSELQREVGFGDFVGEFFLIWFFFVGVWILQPKINEMVGDEEIKAELV